MAFKSGDGSDGHIKGLSVPCSGCGDGFIEHGGSVCLNCGAAIEAVEVTDCDDWDELIVALGLEDTEPDPDDVAVMSAALQQATRASSVAATIRKRRDKP